MNRCSWCNQNNPIYIKYHDEEWGVLRTDDPYLFEMLILESFQAGLSWECVLNKREAFRNAYDHFELEKVILYDEKKIEELIENEGIIRNRLKIKASIKNAKVFQSILKEYGSFYTYLKTFTKGKVYHEIGKTTNKLSDQISLDLKKRKISIKLNKNTTREIMYPISYDWLNAYLDCYNLKVLNNLFPPKLYSNTGGRGSSSTPHISLFFSFIENILLKASSNDSSFIISFI